MGLRHKAPASPPAEQQSRRQGVRRLVLLTTRTADWFQQRGFSPAGAAHTSDLLPPSRRAKVPARPFARLGLRPPVPRLTASTDLARPGESRMHKLRLTPQPKSILRSWLQHCYQPGPSLPRRSMRPATRCFLPRTSRSRDAATARKAGSPVLACSRQAAASRRRTSPGPLHTLSQQGPLPLCFG